MMAAVFGNLVTLAFAIAGGTIMIAVTVAAWRNITRRSDTDRKEPDDE